MSRNYFSLTIMIIFLCFKITSSKIYLWYVHTTTIVMLYSHHQSKPNERRNDEATLPIYLDIHQHIEGLTQDAVAGAHAHDLEVQKKYGVDYRLYWFDENTGKVFYLVEAPSKEAAIVVHRKAHGLVVDEIVEVKMGP